MCVKYCIVPGLSTLDVTAFLTNSVCDMPLNDINCCYDLGRCMAVQDNCGQCPYNSSKYKDGICDEFLNNDMCCYDGGDCPKVLFYDKLPLHCALEGCDQERFGDGICDKDSDDRVCCQDQYDCVTTQQVWDDLTCDTMSAFTKFDTCPRCCNVTGSSDNRISNLNDFCNPDKMTPECCFDNCLEQMNECPTCPISNYLTWINDGICDGFLNNQDCCFDLEDCVVVNSEKNMPRLDSIYGDIQKEYLQYAEAKKMPLSIDALLSDAACDAGLRECFSEMHLMAPYERYSVIIISV